MVVEYYVGVDVLSRNSLGPEFLHEEHLVGKLRSYSVTRGASLLDPVREMPDEVEEEITVWDADNCR